MFYINTILYREECASSTLYVSMAM